MMSLFAPTSLRSAIETRLGMMEHALKRLSRCQLQDDCRTAETVVEQFLGVVCGWDLVNLNTIRPNYPAADLGDFGRRIAIQVTIEDSADKVKRVIEKAAAHGLAEDFDEIIVLFLVADLAQSVINAPARLMQPGSAKAKKKTAAKKPRGRAKNAAAPTPKPPPKITIWWDKQLRAALDGLTPSALRKALDVLNDHMTDIRDLLQPETSRPHNLPYPRLGAGFIGREDELEALRAAVQSGNGQAGIAPEPKITATHGLGGIGKTRLACEYAHRHLWDHDAALFVDASWPDRLRDSIGGLAGLLGDRVPLPADADEEQRRAAVLGWLRQHPAALLILDNIDSEDAARAVKDLLTDPPCRHIILTGRLATWFQGVTPLPLGILSPEKSVAFLLARATGRVATARDAEHALRIAEKLDGLCLLLEQAATYINYRKIPLTRYLRDWEEKHAECLEWWDDYQSRVEGGPRPYGKSVYTTWRTSLDLLTPDARLILDLCAWFAPDPIPDWLFEHPLALELPGIWLDVILEDHPDLAGQDIRLGSHSIASLAESGLATRLCLYPESDEPETAFQIHRIVQDVTRLGQMGSIGTPQARVWSAPATAWILKLFSAPQEDIAGVIRLDPLVPHCLFLAERMDGEATSLERRGQRTGFRERLGVFYHQLANWAHRRGKIHFHTETRRLAFENDSAHYGPEHPDTLTGRNNLANALLDEGKNVEAEMEHRVVLAIRERVLGQAHPDTLQSRNNLAAALGQQGKNVESEAEHRVVLSIRELVQGAEHPDTLASRKNLAIALRAQGRSVEAEAELRGVIAILQRVQGPEHPDTLHGRCSLATALLAQGKYAEAEAEHQSVLSIRRRVLGSEHPDTLCSRNNFAIALGAQRQHTMAEAEHRAVLAVRERVLGQVHPDTLRSRFNLAVSLREQLNWTDALAEAKRAWDGWRSVLGEAHPDTKDAERLVEMIKSKQAAAEGKAGK